MYAQVIAVEIHSDEAPELLATLNNDEVVTDASWKCSAEFSENWTEVDFDDTTWPNAVPTGQSANALFIYIF